MSEKDFENSFGKELSCFLRSCLKFYNYDAKLDIIIDEDKSKDLACTFNDKSVFIYGYCDDKTLQTKGMLDFYTASKIHTKQNFTPLNFSDEFLNIALNYRACKILYQDYPGCSNTIPHYLEYKLKSSSAEQQNIVSLAFTALFFDIKSPFTLYLKQAVREAFYQGLTELENNIYNEEIFTQKARLLAASLELLIERQKAQKQASQGGKKYEALQDKENVSDQDAENESLESKEDTESDEPSDIEKIRQYFNNLKTDKLSKDSQDEAEANKINIKKHLSNSFAYKVFTKVFDKTLNIKSLITNKEEERKIKEKFLLDIEQEVKLQKKQIKNLLNKLLSFNKTRYYFDKDSGMLDKKKFTNIIIGNNCDNIFFTKEQKKTSDIAVTILVDNSGSMRGRLIKISSIICYIIAKTLSKAGVNIEILGFTTLGWNGGASLELFNRQNPNPNQFEGLNNGRVSDILHIVYKSFDQSAIDKHLLNISLMQKESILKENIDGEALQWAYERIAKREEKKKIIFVISDGTPVDDATLSLNDKSYLKDHLRQVIYKIEKQKDIHLIAIGIMHDVGKYYQNAIRIDSIEELSKTLFLQIEKHISFK